MRCWLDASLRQLNASRCWAPYESESPRFFFSRSVSGNDRAHPIIFLLGGESSSRSAKSALCATMNIKKAKWLLLKKLNVLKIDKITACLPPSESTKRQFNQLSLFTSFSRPPWRNKSIRRNSRNLHVSCTWKRKWFHGQRFIPGSTGDDKNLGAFYSRDRCSPPHTHTPHTCVPSSNLIGSRRKLGSGEPSDLVTQFTSSYEKSFLVIVFDHVCFFLPSFRLFRNRDVCIEYGIESGLVCRIMQTRSSLTIKSSTFIAVKPGNFAFVRHSYVLRVYAKICEVASSLKNRPARKLIHRIQKNWP